MEQEDTGVSSGVGATAAAAGGDTGVLLRPHQQDARRAALQAQAQRDLMHQICLPTGGGKTRTAATLVDDFARRGFGVLWVARDWRLLGQAAAEQVALFPTLAPLLRRIGGDGEVLKDLPDTDTGQVYYTTLQTWYARRDELPPAVRPSERLLVVYDECHWAQDSRMGRTLLDRYLGRSLVVGLTATPRPNARGQARVACQVPFADLCGTCLAEPVVREVPTGVRWRPVLHRHEVTARSLRALARDPDRNQVILDELLDGWREGRYRRVLLFACDIRHAEELAALISRSGLAARAIHSRLPREVRQEALLGFREGRVAVLVNVNQLAQGFDLPAVDTVFLARPTASPVLLGQMVGRGARLAPGKARFWIVEFTDRVRQFADRIFHARDLFPSAAAPAILRRQPRPRRHDEPLDAPRFECLELPPLGALTFVRDQTFGVEIELTCPGAIPPCGPYWECVGQVILRRLRECGLAVHPEPVGYHGNTDPTLWYVSHDASAGWEVVSPILRNAEGFEELRRACDGLTDLAATFPDWLRVNYRTGLHVTLGTRLNTDERLRGLLKRVQRLEPGLYTLTAPSRLYHFDGSSYRRHLRNGFCRPLCECLPDPERLDLATFTRCQHNRYLSVNVTHAHEGVEKLEVRMHAGTTVFKKVAPWISLWMHLFNQARYAWAGPAAPGRVFPGGNRPVSLEGVGREDIFALLRAEGIHLGPGLEGWLRRRRAELRPAWQAVLPNRVASWARAGWYAVA